MGGGKSRGCELLRRKSPFVELLWKTPRKTVCPNFFVLAHANGCAFTPRCAYCYLKSSLWHMPKPRVYVNLNEMLREIGRWIAKDDLETYILNMGNLSDSLVFEEDRPLAPALIELFRREAEMRGRPHTLLLVTKGGTKECASLFKTEPCRNAIISFSVNDPAAAARYEKGAPDAANRLEAARRLKRIGWRIRIRIDPMISGFDYGRVAQRVKALRPERVTLGTLRAERNLFRYAGGSSNGLFDGLEKPSGRDSLARYPLEERLKLYRQALSVLKGVCPIGLCEETPEVWKALGLDAGAKTCNCGQ